MRIVGGVCEDESGGAENKKAAGISGSSDALVEVRGLEPLASGLQIGPEQAFCIPVCSGFEEPDLWSVFFSIPSLYDTAPSRGSRSQLVGHLWVTLWFTM